MQCLLMEIQDILFDFKALNLYSHKMGRTIKKFIHSNEHIMKFRNEADIFGFSQKIH
jgi:hypothetical protein